MKIIILIIYRLEMTVLSTRIMNNEHYKERLQSYLRMERKAFHDEYTFIFCNIYSKGYLS